MAAKPPPTSLTSSTFRARFCRPAARLAILLHAITIPFLAYLAFSTSADNLQNGSRALPSSPIAAALAGSPAVDRFCFDRDLRRAEDAFQRHAGRRSMLAGGTPDEVGQPIPSVLEQLWKSERGDWAWHMAELEYYLLPRYPCFEMERVGNWGEGGKWICLQPFHFRRKEKFVVYSIGSNGDASFERDIYDLLGAKTYTFDAFIDNNTQDAIRALPYVQYFSIALTGHPEEETVRDEHGVERPARDIMRIMEMLRHKFVDIFKIDCEGCEVPVVEHLEGRVNRSQPLFGQILMEIHQAKEPSDLRLLFRLRQLGYRMFSLEPNFWAPGDVYEVAFIHESLVTAPPPTRRRLR